MPPTNAFRRYAEALAAEERRHRAEKERLKAEYLAEIDAESRAAMDAAIVKPARSKGKP